MAGAGDLRIGWGDTGDFEILYLYDAGDGGFGYALNLACEWCSEWGTPPVDG